MVCLSVVVPLFNEEANVARLVESVVACGWPTHGLDELVLVENGSLDRTREEVMRLAARHPFITPLMLDVNRQYGGGVLAGLLAARGRVLGYMPGDMQITPADAQRVWLATRERLDAPGACILAKGCRTERMDTWKTVLPSRIYTRTAGALLGVDVQDINGLPKFFPRALVDVLPAVPLRSFTFDAQLLMLAARAGYAFHEVPVVFHARRAGVSSWSGARARTYARTARDIISLRWTRR